MNEPRGRPFPAGNTAGNTMGRGRPRGSRNKASSAGQDLLDKYAQHVVGKCIDLALKGDRSALRICMDRISPARRDACFRMSLPPVRTAQDLDQAAEKLTQGIRRGKIAPAEGEKMMNIFEMRSRIIQTAQWESRIDKLEEEEKEKMADVSRLPRAA